MSMENPLTPAGIEPATFRFVTQHLNHCATAVPSTNEVKKYIHHTRNRVRGWFVVYLLSVTVSMIGQ